MTITQTVEIPADRRITLDLPQELPIGRAKITVTPEAPHITNRAPISQFLGILSPNTYGDAIAYQRKLRNEWND